jgi:hypothetical protein
LRPCSASTILRTDGLNHPSTSLYRLFSSTPIHAGTWLLPTQPEKKRSRKGRPRVPTGGSSRGTTVVWGDYGLRMCDHHRRVSASQLKNGEDAIKQRLRGMRYRLYTRICANIGVYTSGNEVWFLRPTSVIYLGKAWQLLTPNRFVWERVKARSIIGHLELRSARLSSS